MKIAAIHSQQGWKYSISSIRAVPDNSLIFRFCESGNLEGVLELFKRREASVQDVDSCGQTPLHVRTLGIFAGPSLNSPNSLRLKSEITSSYTNHEIKVCDSLYACRIEQVLDLVWR
jgi:hypothetical protein